MINKIKIKEESGLFENKSSLFLPHSYSLPHSLSSSHHFYHLYLFFSFPTSSSSILIFFLSISLNAILLLPLLRSYSLRLLFSSSSPLLFLSVYLLFFTISTPPSYPFPSILFFYLSPSISHHKFRSYALHPHPTSFMS